jgi:predicted esterase
MEQGHDLGFAHRFVPAGGQSPSELTLLLLHGTGGDESDLLPLGRAVSADAALLSPRGKVLERGAPRFFRRLAEGVFDQADLVLRTRELADFVGRAASEYDLDPQRIVAVGYSNGANIAASVLLRHPGVLAGAALLRPMVPFELESPVDLRGTAALISAGQRDPIATPAQTARLSEILRAGGADVTDCRIAAGHEMVSGDVVKVREWLEKFA